MGIGKILTLISITIMVGPLAFAVILYRDNPVALIMPDIGDISEKFEGYIPKFEYAGHEKLSETSFRVFVNITNNSDASFTINEINFSVYCKEHSTTLLGYGSGEDLPLTIESKSLGTLSLLITITQEGRTHIETAHPGETKFDVILRDVTVVVQGITVELGKEIEVEIPT
ncbi:MAG: hypothetical protein AOA66_0871 [Candidatus Bathyarchaeota archaeon BA2]|nr:MAG: hypothetical protein AOA66_0871 [Candidatus Bathyarchaeota archaeon BA2]